MTLNRRRLMARHHTGERAARPTPSHPAPASPLRAPVRRGAKIIATGPALALTTPAVQPAAGAAESGPRSGERSQSRPVPHQPDVAERVGEPALPMSSPRPLVI